MSGARTGFSTLLLLQARIHQDVHLAVVCKLTGLCTVDVCIECAMVLYVCRHSCTDRDSARRRVKICGSCQALF